MHRIVIRISLTAMMLIGHVGCASGRISLATRRDAEPVYRPAVPFHDSETGAAVSKVSDRETPVLKPAVLGQGGGQRVEPASHRSEAEPLLRADQSTSLSHTEITHEASYTVGAEANMSSADDGTPEPGSSLSLVDIEQLALANNPTIQQLSASALKARGIRNQVGVRPNPTIGYFGSQIADAGTDQHGAFVEQEFVTGGKLRLNQRVMDRTVQAQLFDVDTQRYRVLTDIRVQFYETLAAQRRIELTDSFFLVTQQGTEVSRRRKEAMETSQVELLQAEVQMAEISVSRQQAAVAFQGAWKTLMATAGVPHHQPVPLQGDLKPRELQLDWDLVYQNLLSTSPELNAARARVQRARASQVRQEAQPLPNITAQLGAGTDNATGSGLINVMVAAPIPVHNKNQGNISAAWAEYCRATHEVSRLENSLKARLAQASQAFDSAAVAVQTYESTILPKADETLKLSERAYAAGEFDFLQVLIVRRTFFEANLKYVTELANLAQAHATIDGLLLTGGLDQPTDFDGDDVLREQTFSQQ
jgi:cobalt-zinc-cadmium efflux system outer membrane protein